MKDYIAIKYARSQDKISEVNIYWRNTRKIHRFQLQAPVAMAPHKEETIA